MPPLDAERRAWLRLARTDRIGPVTFAGLIARFGCARRALTELPDMTRRGGGKNFVLPPEDQIEREIDALLAAGGRFLFSCDADFPAGLAALDPPPPVISLLGRSDILAREMVAIVGARNASALARKFTADLARGLGEAGLVVVSGLARGIDSAAHEAALDTGTVAVVAGGLDVIYPPENEKLYRAIAESGVILSEVPWSETPQARHFPRRNRLISGLARGVVVVEAAERSGSLITATYALEQGREVFAVPGSPLDPRARGANRLIREGATLTESADDVLAVLRPMLGGGFAETDGAAAVPSLPAPADGEGPPEEVRDRVLQALGPAPVTVDELIRQLGAPAASVWTVILELELAGRCRRQPGNLISWADL
jgi:DNA processing protein